jgi:hypothetical protein
MHAHVLPRASTETSHFSAIPIPHFVSHQHRELMTHRALSTSHAPVNNWKNARRKARCQHGYQERCQQGLDPQAATALPAKQPAGRHSWIDTQSGQGPAGRRICHLQRTLCWQAGEFERLPGA